MAADKVTTFKIYVGNLPDDTEDETVRKIFEEFGTVVQCECVGKKAFVHMEDDIEGKHAVGELQGRELNGNTLTIQEARKNELPRIPTVKLLVKNISSSVDARGLRNMFKRFGYVVEVQVENGEGHVCLEAIGDIRSAISEMNGYKIDDLELAVEPAPVPAEPEVDDTVDEPEPSKSSPKKNKNKGYGNYNSSWSRARQEYYNSEKYRADDYGGYDDYSGNGSYNYNSPWTNPPRSPFNSQPEKILRDPYASPRQQFRGRGSRGPIMPSRILPPPHFGGPPVGPPNRIMRSGFPPRGHPPRGRQPQYQNDANMEQPFYRRDEYMQQSNMFPQEDFGDQVFYEDEPIASISRSKQHFKGGTGANSIPLGGMGVVPRTPHMSNFPKRNGNSNARGGGFRQRGGGRGRGKPQKFTAMTEEIGPGEKYPVPPMNNPDFRAPMKRPKEEVKRKTKKKKKPLVPAELPDYSLPVPQLPTPGVPRGAVLTPFPPPQGQSVIDSDTFGGGGSANFFEQHDQSSNAMDFTNDDVV